MNIYEMDEPSKESETFATLLETSTLKIEAIRSRLTLPGKEYYQEEDEWVILVRGTAALEIEGNVRLLREGESVFIKRHTSHRVLQTSDDALWIGVFNS